MTRSNFLNYINFVCDLVVRDRDRDEPELPQSRVCFDTLVVRFEDPKRGELWHWGLSYQRPIQ